MLSRFNLRRRRSPKSLLGGTYSVEGTRNDKCFIAREAFTHRRYDTLAPSLSLPSPWMAHPLSRSWRVVGLNKGILLPILPLLFNMLLARILLRHRLRLRSVGLVRWWRGIKGLRRWWRREKGLRRWRGVEGRSVEKGLRRRRRTKGERLLCGWRRAKGMRLPR